MHTHTYMKTTMILKEPLLKEAMEVTGVREKTALVHLGLQELVNKAARLRLARLGGALATAKAAPRNRTSRIRAYSTAMSRKGKM